MGKPLAIDPFCGLGGWTEGLLAEGWRVVGFDLARHRYGEHRYPAKLVLQDVLSMHGRQFKSASLIVASPPCQAYSYRAMPWKRAKALPPPDNALFDACFRIQREACAAAGRHIPMVVENVRGAQKWVGRARWHYGSFYLWGDVPALMPIAWKSKMSGRNMSGDPDKRWGSHNVSPGSDEFEEMVGRKNTGGSWFYGADKTGGNPARGVTVGESGRNPVHEGVKQPGVSGLRANGKGDRWFQDGAARSGSKSNARKAASAMIAKIPLPLARWIGRVYYPKKEKP